MQNFPIPHELELKKTPTSEVSQASLNALEIMTAAVRNADFGLIPMFAEFNKPAQRYEEPTPEQDSYDSIVDFNAYRQRNEAAQPQQISVEPENPDILHEDEENELERIRKAVDDVHAEMTQDASQLGRPVVSQIERKLISERPNYGQDQRYVA
jgi:hypothetical protein